VNPLDGVGWQKYEKAFRDHSFLEKGSSNQYGARSHTYMHTRHIICTYGMIALQSNDKRGVDKEGS